MYRTTLPQEAIEYVKEKVQSGNINKMQTARELIEEFDVEGTLDAVRLRVSYLVRQIGDEVDQYEENVEETIKELNEAVDDRSLNIIKKQDRQYLEIYIKKTSRGVEKKDRYELPIKDYDGNGRCIVNICFDYSREG